MIGPSHRRLETFACSDILTGIQDYLSSKQPYRMFKFYILVASTTWADSTWVLEYTKPNPFGIAAIHVFLDRVERSGCSSVGTDAGESHITKLAHGTLYFII